MNRLVRLFFSLRRLPPEYADVERLTLRSAVVAMVILPPFLFPGRHYLLYPILGMLMAYLGRLVGFVRHYSGIGKSPQIGASQRKSTSAILITLGTAILLTLTLYSALTARDPFFVMQAFFGTVLVSFCIGQYWAAPVMMGLLDIPLAAGALILYFHFFLAGYLAAAALAGLLVWHFLLRKTRRKVYGQTSEPVKS